MIILLIALLIIGVIITIILGRRISKQQTFLKQLILKNQEYVQNNEKLILQSNTLQNENKKEQEKLEFLLSEINSVAEVQRETAQKAFESYVDMLEDSYNRAEEEYNESIDLLNKSYENINKIHLQKLEKIVYDVESARATRNAIIAAQVKEKENQEKISFYCLQTKESEIADVKALERIKPQLNNPRVLSMLIWQTFFQKPMTALCNNVLGVKTVCGIYKITNQKTKEAYIGQSVDVSKRWKDHIKCGLGIDAPAGNKLYKAMQEHGVWNFSWELLEECPKEELNAKEKFYIDFYKTYEYGYNSNVGVGK
jgi:hypothetical protein